MNYSTDHVGENIRAIRRRMHLTQAELAHRLNMRPGPVNCIEKGHHLPSARVLCKLAEVLGVPMTAFFTEIPLSAKDTGKRTVAYIAADPPSLGGPHALIVRSAAEAAALDAAALAALSEIVDATLALEDLCGAQKAASIPMLLPFERSEPGLQRLCDWVRRLLGISDAVIFDYLELLENAGLRIVFCRLPAPWESLGCYDETNANAFIFVGDRMNVERQLFRVLYELGRLYDFTLHRPGRTLDAETAYVLPPADALDYRGKPLTPDRIARRFAGLFLMPEAAVRATVAQLGIQNGAWTYDLLLRIKHRFGVSAEAFLYRLDELGLIASSLVADMRHRIHAHYEASNYTEPASTRRVLSPNGRLGDLLIVAARAPENTELASLYTTLQKHGVAHLDDNTDPPPPGDDTLETLRAKHKERMRQIRDIHDREDD